ncbi:MAG: 2-(1,2-epoxy-1,2-dihydrophenyl)acetyl-CoA isomerase [Ottowia sp.]|nr:2-(1,2-epoxy-1,2-dihydrophenyl)acetyl-CoA isomerase [Ottowia sp.]
MSEDLILRNQVDNVLTLTLNRPQRLNSFDQILHRQLREALEHAATDTTVRCLILTGAGRAFCAGQDLNDPRFQTQAGLASADLGAAIEADYRPLIVRLHTMPIPVIAAVNGPAVGAGASLALACDLVVAARSANFIQAFSKIGLLPDSGGTWLLPRLVGRARALGLAWLGDPVSAMQAQEMGLIWQCVDDQDLTQAVTALAHRLVALPIKALIATRKAMDYAQQCDLDSAMAEEGRHQRILGWAHDFQEGVNAFRDKRTPCFTDR